MTNRILRLPEVKNLVGLSKSSIYALASHGTFPRPILISGARSVGWLESEILEFINTRIQASRKQTEVGGAK